MVFQIYFVYNINPMLVPECGVTCRTAVTASDVGFSSMIWCIMSTLIQASFSSWNEYFFYIFDIIVNLE